MVTGSWLQRHISFPENIHVVMEFRHPHTCRSRKKYNVYLIPNHAPWYRMATEVRFRNVTKSRSFGSVGSYEFDLIDREWRYFYEEEEDWLNWDLSSKNIRSLFSLEWLQFATKGQWRRRIDMNHSIQTRGGPQSNYGREKIGVGFLFHDLELQIGAKEGIGFGIGLIKVSCFCTRTQVVSEPQHISCDWI